jgi:hypothetical protein
MRTTEGHSRVLRLASAFDVALDALRFHERVIVGMALRGIAMLLVSLAPWGASGQYQRCRECREPIRREAVVCPFCRSTMPTEVAP